MRVVFIIVLLVMSLAGCSDDGDPADVDGAVVDQAVVDLASADQKASDKGKPDSAVADKGATNTDQKVKPDQKAPDQKIVPDKKAAADKAVTLDAATSCAGLKKAVTDEKARIATCKATSECTFLWGICPFGCHIPHNKTADLTKYKAAIAAYQASSLCQKCTYKCTKPGTLNCKAGKCVMTYP